MLGILILILSIYVSYTKKREWHFFLYNIIVLTLIYLYGIQNYEALYQVEPKTSDTYLYHTAFKAYISDIHNYLFYQYPLFLKILIYPFQNAFFALIVQSNIIFFLLMLITKNWNDLYFFILYTNHTLIFTTVNFFKDNYIIILGLSGIYLLQKTKNKIYQSIILFFTIYLIDMVRPFFKFFYFLIILPFLKNERIQKKHLFLLYSLIFLLIAAVFLIYSQTIFSVLDKLGSSGDSSPGFSITSPIRALFGPTPIRYLFHKNYFAQPFLGSQGYLYYFLHILFYLTFPIILIIFMLDIKKYFYLNNINTDSLFSFSISFLTFAVYQVVYGSADIRQRAVILTFFVFFVLNETKIKISKIKEYKFIYGLILVFEALLSYISL
ncbi:hypothetical protein [Marinitoga lauensis]|uniref:hypothetical protein n=1 Tax=Marinitoga lauensis TaxID=2201189 RepID=UPI001011E9A1|nr:hypothetical protein [Marinitoga lauensis]